jgi:uncharacterized membrane protein YphA (DoxX/SURF4 family)
MNVALWTIQVVLALLFLFAGGTKLLLSIETLTAMGSPNQVQLPAWFLRFIGVCEVAGALGLLLPGLFRVKRFLTPLAAAGLVIVMIGATGISVASGDTATALIPLVTGLLAGFVVYGRSKRDGTRWR